VKILPRFNPGARTLSICYAVGFLSCYATQLVVASEQGPELRANLLYAVILPFREWVAQFWLHFTRSSNIGPALISSLIVGLFFPAAVSLLGAESTWLRLFGLALCALLAFMVLAWGRFPNF